MPPASVLASFHSLSALLLLMLLHSHRASSAQLPKVKGNDTINAFNEKLLSSSMQLDYLRAVHDRIRLLLMPSEQHEPMIWSFLVPGSCLVQTIVLKSSILDRLDMFLEGRQEYFACLLNTAEVKNWVDRPVALAAKTLTLKMIYIPRCFMYNNTVHDGLSSRMRALVGSQMSQSPALAEAAFKCLELADQDAQDLETLLLVSALELRIPWLKCYTLKPCLNDTFLPSIIKAIAAHVMVKILEQRLFVDPSIEYVTIKNLLKKTFSKFFPTATFKDQMQASKDPTNFRVSITSKLVTARLLCDQANPRQSFEMHVRIGAPEVLAKSTLSVYDYHEVAQQCYPIDISSPSRRISDMRQRFTLTDLPIKILSELGVPFDPTTNPFVHIPYHLFCMTITFLYMTRAVSKHTLQGSPVFFTTDDVDRRNYVITSLMCYMLQPGAIYQISNSGETLVTDYWSFLEYPQRVDKNVHLTSCCGANQASKSHP